MTYYITGTRLLNIANAIRTALGVEDKITPAEMAGKILEIGGDTNISKINNQEIFDDSYAPLYLISDTDLINISNSIRYKLDGTDTYTVAEMPAAIQQIALRSAPVPISAENI